METVTAAVDVERPARAEAVRVRDLGVRFGRQVVLEGVSFALARGEITALVGPNGAGKTTLLRALLGEVPQTGERRFYDRAGRPQRPVIGYVPQQLMFDRDAPLSVADLFALATGARPAFCGLAAAARAAGLAALAQTGAAALWERRLGALSGGELQRVLLALSLTPPPDVLLLDEPAQGLDTAGLARFYELVARVRGRFDAAVLLVSHDWAAVARVADQVLLLDRRLLAAGAPAELLASPAGRAWRSGGE